MTRILWDITCPKCHSPSWFSISNSFFSPDGALRYKNRVCGLCGHKFQTVYDERTHLNYLNIEDEVNNVKYRKLMIRPKQK